ncbi:GDSL-type esterase/lipase family protein [Sphingomonas glacialis]|uniref:GDSL-type esterase/lipase family protein n=1 Tax=Sphingomonas glacialis TaxID=658225 RepID=UPI0019D5EDB1|nr:GDSL-type esterase/lipase family protein [Sphingomonas glacialis]
MRIAVLAAFVAGLLAVSPALAQPGVAAACGPTAPAERLSEPWWTARHADVLAQATRRPDPEVVLLGDSITHNYEKAKLPDENFQPTWQRFYAPRHALNLGFGGDTTQHVLWRLRHGELDGVTPKVVVLLIGTNDTAQHHSAAETACGIAAIVGELGQRLPGAKVLLLGVLPSAISPAKSATDAAVNAALAMRYAENAQVRYLDVGATFLARDGTLDTSIFYDPRLPGRNAKALHPDTVGQERMAEAIEPTLAALLQSARPVPLAELRNANTAVIPVPKLEQDSYDWHARHHAELALNGTTRPKIVLIGDSITHFWAGPPVAARRNGPRAWQRLFGASPVLNLGFGWDRTQNVLWRLRQGELRGLAPHEVILNIGTNNLTGTEHARASTPAEVVEGIAAIVAEVRRETPGSRITLMAIFPRGALPTDALRAPIAETNRLLAERFAHDPSLRYLDIGARFLKPDGTLRDGVMLDGTHPSEAGYTIWADALARAGLRR